MILFVCAVPAELAFLVPSPRYDVLATGIGPVEAASAVAAALVRKAYSLVVNAGIAGAFAGRAAIGEGVVVEGDHFADLGTEDGEPLADGSDLVSHVRSDSGFVACLGERGYRRGTGVTVARVTRNAQTAAALAQRYDATLESMEGFAVLRAALLAGVRALQVRGISNIVGPREPGGFDFEGARAALVPLLGDVLEIQSAK